MTLTIELKPELEARLREATFSTGQAASDFIQNLLDTALPAPSHEPRVSAREAALLQQINQGVAEPVWLRYRELRDRLNAEQAGVAGAIPLGGAEHAELLRLIDEIEGAKVERLENLIELAKLRGVSLPEVMKQLGLKAPEIE